MSAKRAGTGQTPGRSLGRSAQRASTAQPAEEIVGSIIQGKYEVLELLSRGGMGVVYKARHLALDTLVALKVLLKGEEPGAQGRFLSEARLASKIRHPNTVYISDVGVLDDGRAFLEMEFLEGRTLGSEIRKGPIELIRACHIVMQIARGLQAVHDKGIIHRDMKPDNVFLVEQDGQKDFVKIVDFGIAKVARPVDKSVAPQCSADGITAEGEGAPSGDGANAHLVPRSGNYTLPGKVMGTPGYMAPEQMQGLPLDGRADQYALGCIFYLMLSGKPVFAARNLQTLMLKHLVEDRPSLCKRYPNRNLPAAIDALVLRLLAREPDQRFASMREVELALQQEIDQLVTASASVAPAVAIGTPFSFSRPVRQLPLVWLSALVVALGIGMGLLGYRLLSKPKEASAPPSRAIQDTPPYKLWDLRQRALTALREDLKSSQAELHGAALAALGETHDQALRVDIEAALRSSDVKTQMDAAAALGALGDRQAIPILAELFEQSGPSDGTSANDRRANALLKPSAQLRAVLAGALQKLGDSRGQRFLEQMLSVKNADLQLRAALLFCDQGPANVKRVLRAFLLQPSVPESTVLGIFFCLARAGDMTARERLHDKMNQAGPMDVKLAAASKLAQLDDPLGRKFLRELMHKRGKEQILSARELALLGEPDGLELFRKLALDPDAQSLVRQLACDGLGAVGEPDDARRLVTLLRDHDRLLRQAGARAILQIVSRDPEVLTEESMRFTRIALADSDALVRESAAAILGDSLSAGAVSLLATLLGDRDRRVRRSAALALGKHREEAAVSVLRGALSDSEPEVRMQALRSLLRLGSVLANPRLARTAGQVRDGLHELLKEPGQRPAIEQVLAAGLLLKMGELDEEKRLRKWLLGPSVELRRLAIEQLPLSADELLKGLSDSAVEVRFMAARKLAEQGDKRALPVLREVVTRGGIDAALAYGLLSQLGSRGSSTNPVERLLLDTNSANRLLAIEALASMPVADAEPLLLSAAHDPDPLVRRMVAEVAADFAAVHHKKSLHLAVQRMTGDADAAVRARAAALLARLLMAQKAAPALPQEAEPVPLSPGRNEKPDGSVVPGKAARLAIPASQIGELAQAGMKSFLRADYKRAQLEMEMALSLCSRDRKNSSRCKALSLELIYRLGQIHERQKAWPEAMNEYQQLVVLAAQVRGKSDIRAAARAAIERLAAHLGQVLVARQTDRGCQQDSIWMRPGIHSIKMGSKFEEIEVHARGIVRVGECN